MKTIKKIILIIALILLIYTNYAYAVNNLSGTQLETELKDNLETYIQTYVTDGVLLTAVLDNGETVEIGNSQVPHDVTLEVTENTISVKQETEGDGISKEYKVNYEIKDSKIIFTVSPEWDINDSENEENILLEGYSKIYEIETVENLFPICWMAVTDYMGVESKKSLAYYYQKIYDNMLEVDESVFEGFDQENLEAKDFISICKIYMNSYQNVKSEDYPFSFTVDKLDDTETSYKYTATLEIDLEKLKEHADGYEEVTDVQPELDTNTDSDTNTNTDTNTDTNTYSDTGGDDSASGETIPDTGTNNLIVIFIIGISICMIVFGIKYYKYRKMK